MYLRLCACCGAEYDRAASGGYKYCSGECGTEARKESERVRDRTPQRVAASIERRNRRLASDPDRERGIWRRQQKTWRDANLDHARAEERVRHRQWYNEHAERLLKSATAVRAQDIAAALGSCGECIDPVARGMSEFQFIPITPGSMSQDAYVRHFEIVKGLNADHRGLVRAVLGKALIERAVSGFPLPDVKGQIIYGLMHEGRAAYIGQTNSLRDRIGEHVKQGAKTFDSVSWVNFYGLADLAPIERYFVSVLQPVHNVSLTRAWWDE